MEHHLEIFDDIVDKYADRLYSFANRLLNDKEAAEDAVQETFIKVWKNMAKIRQEGNLQAWIFTILRNVSMDILRKRKDKNFSSLDTEDFQFGEDIEDTNILASDDLDERLTREVIEEVLQTLSPDQKAIVILHDMEGMTFEEASLVVQKPLNTVKSHYRRAILALRKKVTAPKI